MENRVVSKKITPAWGRAALCTTIATALLTYVGVASNFLPGGSWFLVLAIGLAVSVVLAIVSLVRGERRVLATVTLSIVVAAPLALLIGFLVFFQFFYRG